MKPTRYIVPEGYRANRACMLTFEGIDICMLIECVNPLEGDKAYLFVPEWDGVDNALKAGMYDIPGLDLSLRLPQYDYVGRFPAFLTFRFVPLDRPDWQWHYKYVGLEHNQDQWEYMVRMGGMCHEDRIRVRLCSP